jgi:hypothetical protein
MDSSNQPNAGIPVVTSVADAPMFYADLLYHVTWFGGVARLAFIRNVADAPEPGAAVPALDNFKGHHVATIALPATQLVAMRDYLNTVIGLWTPDG